MEVRLLVQLEDAAIGVLVLVGAQRAEVVAQALGEHGDGAVHEVDAGGAAVGLLVDEAALGDVVADIGDMHAHLVVPIR